MKRTILLSGLNGQFQGKSWKAEDVVRVGRLGPLEMVLDDSSVSRNHAEIRYTERGWRVRDLGSTNGTLLNGVRLSAGQWPLRVRDFIQFGEVAIVVETLSEDEAETDDITVADLRVEAAALAANVSAGIECAQLIRKQRDLFLDTITILAQAVEMRDQYTGGHTRRVSTYAILLAQELNLPPQDIELIRIGTPLHDIGKIGIDDAILRKPDRLTTAEYEIMKSHTVKGADIVATVPDLRPIIPIVRSHHERWDSKGYPDGLGGEAIPPVARVVALADAFDAMTSNRPYRKGLPPTHALAVIENVSGQQFDPTFAAAFLGMQQTLIRELKVQANALTPSKRVRILARG